MKIWPFSRPPAQTLPPEELRDVLVAAASGPPRRLRTLCEQYKHQVSEHLDLLSKMPADLAPADFDDYAQRIGTVAGCLRTRCGAPQLWDRLTGREDGNPLVRWGRWLDGLPARMERLEHDALIEEVRAHIDSNADHVGAAARKVEAALYTALGHLQFHSGNAEQAREPFEVALPLHRMDADVEAEIEVLIGLMQVHRYLGQPERAADCGDEALRLHRQHGMDAGALERHVRMLRAGEPACRLVIVTEDQEWELEEYAELPEGPYELQFRRNRPAVQRCVALVQRGLELTSEGRLIDALETFRAAAGVDPHDPDPRYRMGLNHMHAGEYVQAQRAFEEVERIAPGWMWSRTELWLARGLESGAISEEELRLHRALEDPELESGQALQLAQDAVRRWPGFAPFYLALGEIQSECNDPHGASASFRAGLERVSDPDLESRLLGALAGLLAQDSTEREELLDRIMALEGSLLARAVVGFMRTGQQ